MSIDRDLLWKAWPRGYIAILGAGTVGGWLCRWVGMNGRVSHFFILETIEVDNDGYKHPRFREVKVSPRGGKGPIEPVSGDVAAVKRGDLLPKVDPSDVATWACLLADFAAAVWPGREALAWTWQRWDSDGVWALCAVRPKETDKGMTHVFDIETDDAAEALVRARIQVREETGR